MAAAILPAHEQHWPDKLLPTRLQEYVRDDGQPPTTSRAYAKRVSGAQVIDAVIRAQQKLQLSNIDLRYYVGTVFHEAGCTNEWDTEIATPSNVPGFVSVGAYQIGDEEAQRYGFVLADMLDLDKSTECMVRMAEDNRNFLRVQAFGLGSTVPDPDYTDANGRVYKAGTMRAYLAIAHNHGTGYAKQTIRAYGMDWSAYKLRNPKDNIVAHGYGEDCVTGGEQWLDDPIAPTPPALGRRVLRLMVPNMTGADVREVQNHLREVDPKIAIDGDFGPRTFGVLKLYQLKHGLVPDGVVGPQTWNWMLQP